jgi:hypothetical protein
MGKKSGSGSGDWDEQPGSYFRELRSIFWVLILKFFDAEPGSGRKKIRIGDLDKHPGSAIQFGFFILVLSLFSIRRGAFDGLNAVRSIRLDHNLLDEIPRKGAAQS